MANVKKMIIFYSKTYTTNLKESGPCVETSFVFCIKNIVNAKMWA